MDTNERVDNLYKIISDVLKDMSRRYSRKYSLQNDEERAKMNLRMIVDSNRDYLITYPLFHYLISKATIPYYGFNKGQIFTYLEALASNNDALIIKNVIYRYLNDLDLCTTVNRKYYFEGQRLSNEGPRILKELSGLEKKLLYDSIEFSDKIRDIPSLGIITRTDMYTILFLYASKALIINNYDYFANKVKNLLNNYNDLLIKLELMGVSDPLNGLHYNAIKGKKAREMIEYITNEESAKKLIIE